MSETAPNPVYSNNENKRLPELLQAAAECFSGGDDRTGLENLLTAVEKLEKTVETDQHSLQPKIDILSLIPIMKDLYYYMRCRDITGITDLLEDTLCPTAENWTKGGSR